MRNEKPKDADWVLKQHRFSKGQYGEALRFSAEVEKLWKADFDVPRDTSDSMTSSKPRITRPARARAILEKFLTLLQIRANQQIHVVPKNTGESEQRACEKLEQWLNGYQRCLGIEMKKNVYRDFVYFFLLRGRGCIETRFDTKAIGGEYMPIRTMAHDPNQIYSVWGESGIGWYTKEYTRHCWDIRQELENKKKLGNIKLPDDANKRVVVIEYWDSNWNALLVDNQLVWINEHEYGFVPLCEAHCMGTPINDMRWAYQSVLGPIMDSLKQQYIMASKMATGVDLYYYPKVLVQSATGQAVILDSGVVGVEAQIPPDAKVTVLNPTTNAQVMQQIMSFLRADEQIGGIPEVAFAAEPANLQSGFAVSQVLSQVMDKIYDKKTAIEQALGWDFGHKLQLIEKFGDMDGLKLTVPVTVQEAGGRSGKRATLVEIKPEDVDGRYYVEVMIQPEMPQDRMIKAQLASAFRNPGVDGSPLLDDRSILESVLELNNHDEIARRVREQMLPKLSPKIQEMLTMATEQQWIDDNKSLVKLAEKRKKQVEEEQMQEQIQQQVMGQMVPPPPALPAIPQSGAPQINGINPAPQEVAQFLQMLQGQQGGGTASPNPLAMPILPQQGATMPMLGAGPGAMSSQVMPSQIQMSAQDLIPDIPQELILDQMRRAQRPPTPRGM
jgi:hypothetical protein